MDISNDAVRRSLREIDACHREELASTTEGIDRLYQAEAPSATKWDVITGGAQRARWMRVGGVAVLSSAVLAACSGGGEPAPPAAAPGGPTTTTPEMTKEDPADLRIFRFSASLENLAVAAYDTAAKLIKTPALLAAATLFQGHHKDHAKAFNGQLVASGEKAFTEPNSVLLATLKPQLDALASEEEALAFALDLEVKAASTYFASVSQLQGPKLSSVTMSIGATEFRHAALLSNLTGKPIASTAAGFLTTAEAVAPVGV
jgi:rubrerythrin